MIGRLIGYVLAAVALSSLLTSPAGWAFEVETHRDITGVIRDVATLLTL